MAPLRRQGRRRGGGGGGAKTNNLCVPEVCLNAWKTNFTTQRFVSRVGKTTYAGCAELVSPGGKQTHATIVEFVSQPGKQTLFRKSLFFRRRNKLHLCAGAGILAGFRRGLQARVRAWPGPFPSGPCGGLASLRPVIPPQSKLKKVAFL